MARTPHRDPEAEKNFNAFDVGKRQLTPEGSDGTAFVEERDVDTERGITHPNAPAYQPQTPNNFRKRR